MRAADTPSTHLRLTMFGWIALALPHALAWKSRMVWRKRRGVHTPTHQEHPPSKQGPKIHLKEKARSTHANTSGNIPVVPRLTEGKGEEYTRQRSSQPQGAVWRTGDPSEHDSSHLAYRSYPNAVNQPTWRCTTLCMKVQSHRNMNHL